MSNPARVWDASRHMWLPPEHVGYAEALAKHRAAQPPVPMLLYCPVCGRQHVDEVDPVGNPGWENPPHTSHKCLECGCVWRPADVPTEGVRSLETVGRSDTWTPGTIRVRVRAQEVHPTPENPLPTLGRPPAPPSTHWSVEQLKRAVIAGMVSYSNGGGMAVTSRAVADDILQTLAPVMDHG